MKVKIYGAGSIGNHLAQASRRMGWDVVVVDPDAEALRRMREDIYPKRYGAWDAAIQQFRLGEEPKGGFDVIFLGTPPHVRMAQAKAVLAEDPKVLQCEKPICTPDLAGMTELADELARHPNTMAVDGFEYNLSGVVNGTRQVLSANAFGAPQTMDVAIRENWSGIFSAHPWLSGPADTYLGYFKKGGGAMCEHSHGISLWQELARHMGQGKVVEVNATLDVVRDGTIEYDRLAFLTLTTETGFMGRVVQDVVTLPVKLGATIQCADGSLEIVKGATKDGDLLRWQLAGGEPQEQFFAKKRPDDFHQETLHIGELLAGRVRIGDSPIAFSRGMETMLVIAAAFKSHGEKRPVRIDWSAGMSPAALQ